MKTTIEIADSLFAAARRRARADGRTLRSVVEEALRRLLGEDRSARPFRLRRRHVGGKGLQPGIREGGWETVRDLIRWPALRTENPLR